MSNEHLDHVGRNIRAIRRRRHLSQTELAKRLGMRPGPVNCIEKGRNLPSAAVLHKLSQVLEVPIDAFFQPAVGPTTPTIKGEAGTTYLAYSADARALGPCALLARTEEESQKMPDTLCTLVTTLADTFLTLEDLCGAMKCAELPLGIPFARTEQGIRQLCDRVRRILGVSDAVIFDYLELLENAGLRVLFVPLPEGVGSVSCHDVENGNAFLFVDDAGSTPERRLFRLCYELGRLYVHAPERYNTTRPGHIGMDSRRKPFTEDRTARRFAGLFLMPEAALGATVRQLGIRPGEWTQDVLYRVKHRFGVSAEALLYRLKELHLISEQVSATLKEGILQHYREHDNSEPDATRRILTPNGRLGDLLLLARQRPGSRDEAEKMREILVQYGLPGIPEALEDEEPAE